MLTIQDAVQSAVMKLTEGNPGALRVCCEIVQGDCGLLDILHMDDMGLRGPSIWLGYKDFAGEDIEKFRGAVRSRNPDMVRTIKAAGGEAWTGGRS